jgi:hypothetical protein
MPRVTVALVNVVGVVAVRYRDVPARRPVLMVVALVGRVHGRLALVDMIAVNAMQMPVVDVVIVIAVWERHMPAVGPVPVAVVEVLAVLARNSHDFPPVNEHWMST